MLEVSVSSWLTNASQTTDFGCWLFSVPEVSVSATWSCMHTIVKCYQWVRNVLMNEKGGIYFHWPWRIVGTHKSHFICAHHPFICVQELYFWKLAAHYSFTDWFTGCVIIPWPFRTESSDLMTNSKNPRMNRERNYNAALFMTFLYNIAIYPGRVFFSIKDIFFECWF